MWFSRDFAHFSFFLFFEKFAQKIYHKIDRKNPFFWVGGVLLFFPWLWGDNRVNELSKSNWVQGFLFSILWGRWIGNNPPQEDLAKFC
jgi:hypothetical protein